MTTEDRKKVLEKDFSREETRRSEFENFRDLVGRGSYRMQHGLFHTEEEYRDYLDDGLQIPFPTPKPTLVTRIRSFFRR